MRILMLLLVLSLAVAAQQPIKVGILYSQTGLMAPTETPLVDAALLAIKQINAKGGVLGRPLEPVVRDGRSDPATFAVEARKLISQEKVAVVFGTWTSDCRRAVLPVLDQLRSVLFYGVQYEGGEEDPNVIYTGQTANQQLFPALKYMVDAFGDRVYFVGTDSYFSHAIHAEARRALMHHCGRGEVAEVYKPMGAGEFQDVVADIERLKPAFILLTLGLEGTESFYQAYTGKTPVLTLSIAELELDRMPVKPAGLYICRGYFSTLDIPLSRRFVGDFRREYGKTRPVDDNVQTAWFQLRAWAKAAEKAGSVDPAKVRQAARGLIVDTPSGLVRIDPKTQHTWRTCRIGQVQPDGSIGVVWSSELPVKPAALSVKGSL